MKGFRESSPSKLLYTYLRFEFFFRSFLHTQIPSIQSPETGRFFQPARKTLSLKLTPIFANSRTRCSRTFFLPIFFLPLFFKPRNSRAVSFYLLPHNPSRFPPREAFFHLLYCNRCEIITDHPSPTSVSAPLKHTSGTCDDEKQKLIIHVGHDFACFSMYKKYRAWGIWLPSCTSPNLVEQRQYEKQTRREKIKKIWKEKNNGENRNEKSYRARLSPWLRGKKFTVLKSREKLLCSRGPRNEWI